MNITTKKSVRRKTFLSSSFHWSSGFIFGIKIDKASRIAGLILV